MSEQLLPYRQFERQRFAALNFFQHHASSDAIDSLTGMSCAFSVSGENFSDSRGELVGGGHSLGVEAIRWKSSRTR